MSGHFEILNAWLAFESDCPGYTGTGVHTDTCAATALMAALRAGAYSDFYIFLEAVLARVRAPTPLDLFRVPPPRSGSYRPKGGRHFGPQHGHHSHKFTSLDSGMNAPTDRRGDPMSAEIGAEWRSMSVESTELDLFFSSTWDKYSALVEVCRGSSVRQVVCAIAVTTLLIIGVGVNMAHGPAFIDASDGSGGEGGGSGDGAPLSQLREDIAASSARALAARATTPLSTEYRVIRDPTLNMDFIVSYADDAAAAAKVSTTAATTSGAQVTVARERDVLA